VKTHRLLVAIALTLVPAAANAATIDFLRMGNAEIVSVAGIRTVRAWAGELMWSWVDGKPNGATNDPFYSYCVDLLNNERDPQYNVAVTSTDGMKTDGMLAPTAVGAQKAVWLFDKYAAGAHDSSSTALAAGLQLAIWEVLFDDGKYLTFDSSQGAANRFYVTDASAGALYAGNYYLSQLNSPWTDFMSAPSALWLDVASGQGQDQITSPVPEPGTLLLLGTGLAVVMRRRRSKQA